MESSCETATVKPRRLTKSEKLARAKRRTQIKECGNHSGIVVVQRHWTRRYKAGYELRCEEWLHSDEMPAIRMTSAYNPHGEYIGTARNAHYLCVKRGIAPIKANPKHSVCSIGYCSRDGKWYGWSHRAIYGFKVGDTIKKGDCTADGPLPLGFTALDIEDALMMAEAFAASVS